MSTLQSFTVFSALPTELRLLIWSVTLVRRVELRNEWKITNFSNGGGSVALYKSIDASYTIPPPILSVSREARELALEQYSYQQAAIFTIKDNRHNRHTHGKWWATWKYDTVVPCGENWNAERFNDFIYSINCEQTLSNVMIDVTELDDLEILMDCVSGYLFSIADECAIYGSEKDRSKEYTAGGILARFQRRS